MMTGSAMDGRQKWMVHVEHRAECSPGRAVSLSHPDCSQLIFIPGGRGQLSLNGCKLPFDGPCVLLLPTDCVHALDEDIAVARWIVTVEAAYLDQVNARLPEFIQLWAVPRMISLSGAPDTAADFHDLVKRLEKEMQSKALGHVVEMEAVLSLLLLTVLRGVDMEQLTGASARPVEICMIERFRKLIDQHFRQNLPVQGYASMMAVSVARLRAACIAATGQNPAKMIHARVVTEAKRKLIFSDLSIEQIAFALGFSHASYFTRFFGKEVGETPGRFRTSLRG